jgi:hypothetical protein
MYARLPELSPSEEARTKQTMETLRRDLCHDFGEMVRMSERTLGVPLSDHYSLFEACQEG